jgi:hypothetical protein
MMTPGLQIPKSETFCLSSTIINNNNKNNNNNTMKLSVAAVLLTLSVTPACAYMAQLERQSAAAKVASGEAQYYTTSGTTDKHIGSASSGIKNYLDALVTSPTTTPRGAGLTSYLDALPQNTASSITGSGMSSYAESLNKAGSITAPKPAAAAAAAAAVAPAAPTSFAATGNVATTSMSYLQAISSNAAPISGAGMRTYLDALPASPVSAISGAGITTYLDALPRGASVSGAGIKTYVDALSPTSGVALKKGSYAPAASGSAAKPAFAIGSVSGSFDFSFEVDSSIMEKIAAANGRKVVLSGRVESVSYN